MKKITMMIFVLAMIAGCAGNNCFEIGGTWDDKNITGNFKYCFSKQKSDIEGRPVLIPDEPKKETLIALPESEIDKINETLESNLSQTSSSKKLETPCQKLLRLLKDIKNLK